MSRIASFGTWASPLSAAAVAASGLRLVSVSLDGDDIYWLEGRPHEQGRYALVRRRPDGTITEATPSNLNIRSRVHEYGGGAYVVAGGVVYCANFSDQRVYRVADGAATPLTAGPPSETAGGARRRATREGDAFYADFELDARRDRLICVREDHTDPAREPTNTLVSISVDGTAASTVLVAGADFYSTPRLSPDGARLAWLSWNHPALPWDGTALWVADVDSSGAISNQIHVAGGGHESIYQPGWSPDGVLYFASDRDGWWKLYRWGRSERSERSIEPVVRNPPADAEFGRPQWVFGTSTWAFAGSSRLVVSYTRAGRWHLADVDLASGMLTNIDAGLQPHEWLAADATHAVFVAGSETRPDAVVRLDLATQAAERLREASSSALDEREISAAEPIEFPTSDGTAHAFFYAPRSQAFTAPASEKPPLIVISHGGPTSAAESSLDLKIQYWTSRGFAVADVNYRGSSGYGRAYRDRLRGQWGIVDVDDVICAARFLSDRTDADRLIIRGGSAGGYTTLAALTFRPGVFKAGASYFGISDLEVLEVDAHKFESRYSHSLIGPYPASKETYHARSPIHFVDRLACPLILFQGLEDKVVPPNQSQMMADAVRANGLPVAYLAFEGEQHGFRKAETIIRCLEAELYFYGKVFGFNPADSIEPLRIDNLRA